MKVKSELCRIFHNHDLPKEIRGNFRQWRDRLLNYAEKSSNQEIVSLMETLENSLSEDVDSIEKEGEIT